MLSKFLLIGVGGSGGKTLRALRSNLELKLNQANWTDGLPMGWQLLHIDSPVKQDGTGFPAPMLPSSDYQALSRSGLKYGEAYTNSFSNVEERDLADYKRFLPDEKFVNVDPTAGAGQFRGVGRVLALAAHSQIKTALRRKLDLLLRAEADPELKKLARQLGLDDQIAPSPTIIVISSIAGGSGAGQFLEISEMIKGLEPSQNWVHEIFNMLYAPDVFTEVDPELLAGNALFSMGEIMSGLWTSPAAGTIRMTKKMGTNVPYQDSDYKTGAKYNFMIGKGGFAQQQDVYLAVASSLTTWMTDQEVNDKITAFTRGNYQASTLAANLPDHSGLKEDNKDATPFMALGFGRVGLGKERFVAYSAQRLARSAIDRMLYAHTLEDPKFSKKTEDEWITFFAEKNLFDFMDSVKLNEETEAHNDIIDAIRPNRDTFYAELKAQVLAVASQTLNPRSNAQSLVEWDDSLRAGFNNYIEQFMDSEAKERNAIMRPWVKQKKVDLLTETSRYVAQHGIKVTREILYLLSIKLTGVADELSAEAQVSLKYSKDLSSYIRGELGKFPEKNQNEIPAGHEVIDAALREVAFSFYYRAEASLKQIAALLVADMAKNFIDPLREDLLGIHRSLAGEKTKQEFANWSTEESPSVPRQFEPSKNEKLLIETADYPDKFAELVNNSVNSDRRANAMRVVVNEVIMGGLAIPDLDRRNYWEFITTMTDWVPSVREAREDSQQNAQSAKFDVSINPVDYLERAQRWMKRIGTPFAGFLNESLSSYLTNERDKSILKERQDKFLLKLEEAITDGAPLVNINQGLLSRIHDGRPKIDVVISTIPMDATNPIFSKVEEILKEKGLTGAVGGKTFDPQSANQSIDFFSVHQGMQPMVLDSIIGPISKYWNEHNGLPSTRQSLMQHRRPRYLYESIPAGDKPKQDILKGYFVARALKQFKSDKEMSKEEKDKKGPKLSLWSGNGSKWCEFPFPLLAKDEIEALDFPGGILFSISLAIVACNGSQSLEPLEPYKRLQKLAESKGSGSNLKQWILTGDLAGAPTPDPKRAGSREDSPQVRRETLISYFNGEMQKYEARFAKQSLPEDHDDSKEKDLTWELREPVLLALKSLQKEIHIINLDESEDED
jgi:hypothetical protein